jgi:hypothetical protein
MDGHVKPALCTVKRGNEVDSHHRAAKDAGNHRKHTLEKSKPMASAISLHISFCFSTVNASCPLSASGTTYVFFTGDEHTRWINGTSSFLAAVKMSFNLATVIPRSNASMLAS